VTRLGAFWHFLQRATGGERGIAVKAPTVRGLVAAAAFYPGGVLVIALLAIGLVAAGVEYGAEYASRVWPAIRDAFTSTEPEASPNWRHRIYGPDWHGHAQDDYECDREATAAAQDRGDAHRRLYAKCMIARGYVWR